MASQEDLVLLWEVERGEDLPRTMTVTDVPSAITSATLMAKLDPAHQTDGEADLGLTITSALSSAGQVTDTGADGTGALWFRITAGDTGAMQIGDHKMRVKIYCTNGEERVVAGGILRIRQPGIRA